MSATNKPENGSNLINQIESGSVVPSPSDSSSTDTQVKVRKKYSARRTYDVTYKLRILAAYNACESASERGALLRKEGLYASRICDWKQALENAKLSDKKKAHKELRVDHLTKENEQLKKKLAHAEAIIDLQKKLSDLLGMHILPVEKGGSIS